MKDLDAMIAESLDAEDRELMDALKERGVFGQLKGLFEGRMGWFGYVTFVLGLVFVVIGVYAVVKFLGTDDIAEMLRWLALAWMLFFAQSMLKIWSWMRMGQNELSREIKRLELQVVRLKAELAGR